jgi:hypothetical protein
VGIMAEEVALRAGFPETFVSPENSSSVLAPLSSGGGTVGPLVAWTPSGLSRAPLQAIKEKDLRLQKGEKGEYVYGLWFL